MLLITDSSLRLILPVQINNPLDLSMPSIYTQVGLSTGACAPYQQPQPLRKLTLLPPSGAISCSSARRRVSGTPETSLQGSWLACSQTGLEQAVTATLSLCVQQPRHVKTNQPQHFPALFILYLICSFHHPHMLFSLGGQGLRQTMHIWLGSFINFGPKLRYI